MERYNGFLDLDKYYKNLEKDRTWFEYLFNVKKYEKTYDRCKGQYWLTINGEEYFFKPSDNPYAEVIAYECAKHLDFNVTPYYLAIYLDTLGVISKSFLKKGCNYISGTTILEDYINNPNNLDYLKLMGFYNRNNHSPSWKNINNLEIIWQAIEYRYKDKNIDFSKVMYDMVLYFIFNILLCQNDAMAPNWQLEESDLGVSLTPIYDNEFCLWPKRKNGTHCCNLTTNFNDNKLSNDKVLDEFLKVSSSEFIELFLEKYNALSLDVFLKIIENLENSIKYNIPSKIKEDMIWMFIKNKDKLEMVLSNHNLIRTRKKCEG